MNKQDLTQHSDSELSLLVFNDEYLYRRRHFSNFLSMIDEFFIYTPEQLTELKQDLIDDSEAAE